MFGVTAKRRFGRSIMNSRISCGSALAAALLALPLFSFGAAGQIAVSSNDGKALNVNGAYTVPEKPVDDTVTIIDLGVSPPKLLGEVKAPSGVVGPPQNVAITTDESIALVAAAMKLDPADPKKLTPDNRLSVIDLKAKPPAVIATIETGLGPSGVSINRAGTLALIANANEGTVSILTIGKSLRMIGEIKVNGSPEGLRTAEN
jgi:DNA-binding beta-propeller fold protein YncE